MTTTTSLPDALKARAMGYSGAVPKPPPTRMTLCACSISVGLPRGPQRSRMWSPAFKPAISLVVFPTVITIRLIVPASGSMSASESGMRSPRSWSRTITNWPGNAFFAIKGAAIL